MRSLLQPSPEENPVATRWMSLPSSQLPRTTINKLLQPVYRLIKTRFSPGWANSWNLPTQMKETKRQVTNLTPNQKTGELTPLNTFHKLPFWLAVARGETAGDGGGGGGGRSRPLTCEGGWNQSAPWIRTYTLTVNHPLSQSLSHWAKHHRRERDPQHTHCRSKYIHLLYALDISHDLRVVTS